MRALRLVFASSLLVAAALGSGCRFGEARFDSTVSGRGFDPGGTVFTYVDEHSAALVAEDDPRVAVAMTWVVFDPGADLTDWEGSELADVSHEMVLRDGLALVFDAQSAVQDGASFESVVRGGVEQGDGLMTALVHLAPERLSSASTYAEVVPLASERHVAVEIELADFVELRELRGTATLSFERTDNDPGDALTGTFTGTFHAPLVDERHAEQNLAVLQADEVLGLPLPPRSGL